MAKKYQFELTTSWQLAGGDRDGCSHTDFADEERVIAHIKHSLMKAMEAGNGIIQMTLFFADFGETEADFADDGSSTPDAPPTSDAVH